MYTNLSNEVEVLALIEEVRPLIVKFKKELRNYCMDLAILDYVSIDEFMTTEIKKLGDFYFPNLISEGHCACHYTVKLDEDRVVDKTSNNISLDFGFVYKKLIPIDTAFTIKFNESEADLHLAESFKICHRDLLKIINSYTTISTISEFIENSFDKTKYCLIAELTGHTLSPQKIHGRLSIPNVSASVLPHRDELETIRVGEFFTIEPSVCHRTSKSKPYELIYEAEESEAELFATAESDDKMSPMSLKHIIINEIAIGEDVPVMIFPPVYSQSGSEVFHYEETYYMSSQGPILITNEL